MKGKFMKEWKNNIKYSPYPDRIYTDDSVKNMDCEWIENNLGDVLDIINAYCDLKEAVD
jgi:hypothetical protein